MQKSNLCIITLYTSIFINYSSSHSHHLMYDIDCDFKTQKWQKVGEVYACAIISNLIVTERHIGISAMNGNHETGKTSADVSAVHAYLRTVNFIPDFTPVTRNVKGLSFVQCRLIMLRKQDLQPYNKLEYLWLNENYLKHLDGDAFMYNQNIKVINLQSNKLTKIDRNIFKNLIPLEVLILNKNECLKNVTESQLHMADWMNKINEFCQNYPEAIVARLREEYKRNVREKTSIWVTFGVTFASFSVVVIVIVILYNIKRFISL